MIIAANVVIILTLGCFITGIIAGVQLIRPQHYGSGRSRSSATASPRRYDD